MALFLTNEEVERLVTVEDAIEVLEPTFADLGAGRLSSRPRTLNYTGLGGGEFYLYSCMDASVPRYGVHLIRMTSEHLSRKVVKGFPRRYQIPNPAGKFSGLIIMFSIEDHAPLALFQDAVLNRTMIGATSGIAAKHLSRADSEVMALLGAGWLAPDPGDRPLRGAAHQGDSGLLPDGGAQARIVRGDGGARRRQDDPGGQHRRRGRGRGHHRLRHQFL